MSRHNLRGQPDNSGQFRRGDLPKAQQINKSVTLNAFDRACNGAPKPKPRSAPPSGMWEMDKILNAGQCARHAWDKDRLGIKEPYKPFPSVFGAVDKAMRYGTEGRSVSEVLGDEGEALGEGVFRQPPKRFTQHVETDSGHDFVIRGELDALVEHPDGSLTIVDFKHRPVGDREAMQRSAEGYRSQLEAYTALLGEQGHDVRGAAILWLGPAKDNLTEVGEAKAGQMNMSYDFMLSEVEVSEDRYWDMLDRWGDLMSGDRPPVSDDCETCQHQQALLSSMNDS